MTVFGLILALELSEADRDLVDRLKKRDPRAMADIYDRFGRLAYSLILGMVRDSATAEDLVQETFLRIWNRIQAFDGERGALGPWLLAVARNRAIDYLRSSAARASMNTYELEEREHPALFANIEERLSNAEQAKRIKRAMERLNENQKRVIELAYYEGLSQSEMAEKMGQPLGTVKTWVRAALKVLRDEMGAAAAA